MNTHFVTIRLYHFIALSLLLTLLKTCGRTAGEVALIGVTNVEKTSGATADMWAI